MPALNLFSGSRPEPDRGLSGDRRRETRTLPLSGGVTRAFVSAIGEPIAEPSRHPSAAQPQLFSNRDQRRARRFGLLRHALPIQAAPRSTFQEAS